jgi:16S rRNA (guanine966-N2)-methyltransferase
MPATVKSSSQKRKFENPMARKRKHLPSNAPPPAAHELRIIGGTWRKRKLAYHGDPVTRPMKDRVREAVFNLIGPSVVGTHALDLFAGTGALALEALSRGATRATLIERHFPTARLLKQNVEVLKASDRAAIVSGDAFLWVRRLKQASNLDAERPWTVFVSPPWDFYAERKAELLEMIGKLASQAPEGSVIAVESDERFDTSELPDAEEWDVRTYPPAVIAVRRIR